MKLKIFTDGGSKGNPGPAAIGFVIYKGEKEVVKYREDIGIATNNIAEYTSLQRAFEYVLEQKIISKDILGISCYADSNLMIQQLLGRYKIKNENLQKLIKIIKTMEKLFSVPVEYIHIPREKNKLADALVNNQFIVD